MQLIIWKVDTNTVAVVVQGKIRAKSCNNQDFVSWSLISVICINVSSFRPWLELDDLELLLGACGYPCSQLDTPKCNCTGKPVPLLISSQTDSPIFTHPNKASVQKHHESILHHQAKTPQKNPQCGEAFHPRRDQATIAKPSVWCYLSARHHPSGTRWHRPALHEWASDATLPLMTKTPLCLLPGCRTCWARTFLSVGEWLR